jgi:hypothetical protein
LFLFRPSACTSFLYSFLQHALLVFIPSFSMHFLFLIRPSVYASCLYSFLQLVLLVCIPSFILYFLFLFLPSKKEVHAEGSNKNKKYMLKEGIQKRSTCWRKE